jgi:hypothetical protein
MQARRSAPRHVAILSSYRESPCDVFKTQSNLLEIVLKAGMSQSGQALYEFGPFRLDPA